MDRRSRLMATMRGAAVDRPAISFYEIGGFLVNPSDKNPYNVYNSPDWQPLLELAENHTDIIRMMSPVRKDSHISWENAVINASFEKHVKIESWEKGDSKYSRINYFVGNKKLSSVSRRDKSLDTVWTIEPLIKTREDVHTYLDLPDEVFAEHIDCQPLFDQEELLGDRGIVMVDTEDPVCAVAGLFTMEEFALFAFTEPDLCHSMLQKHARIIQRRTEIVSREFPGHLWRIFGPEYITPPFFPPSMFDDFVVKYDAPMISAIQDQGGFARIHCHGNVKEVLPAIVDMGADAIDPLEPPCQGNIELAEARKLYGDKLVLFGNIEVSDIENMSSDKFRQVVKKSIVEGSSGSGRGFVLMPSASPYGRDISALTIDNYHIMVEEACKEF